MHREEREFSIILSLLAEFEEDYEGDQDGFQWHQEFLDQVRPRLLAAVIEVLRSDPRWRAVPAPRGRDPERAFELCLTRKPS